MFNYDARQLFVVHPRGAGGGILTNILSLDSRTAAQNFKNYPTDVKLEHLTKHLGNPTTKNAHTYGIVNFMMPNYIECVANADWSDRYVQKCHYSELISDIAKPTLEKMQNKIAIGISLTDECLDAFTKLDRGQQFIDRRGPHGFYNYYYQWTYSNLNTLLPRYFNIELVHSIIFKDLLNIDTFLTHIDYIAKRLDLDLDLSVASQLIQEWHAKIGVVDQ